MAFYTILQGDVFARVKEIPPASVDFVVTSPPYWRVRDYKHPEQLGNEPTVDLYLENLIRWVREIERTLKPTGAFMVNLGDKFDDRHLISVTSRALNAIEQKTPFELQSEIIWGKPNGVSGPRTRVRHAHEKLFIFSKGKPYFDERPLLIQIAESSKQRKKYGVRTTRTQGAFSGERNKEIKYSADEQTMEKSWLIVAVGQKADGFETSERPKSAHVAPFPEELIKPFIDAYTPKDGVVFDPFLGSGTTLKVARDLRRSCYGIEINPDYIALTKKRVNWANGVDGNLYEEK